MPKTKTAVADLSRQDTMTELIFLEELNLICWFPTGVLDSNRIIDVFNQVKACPWANQANRFCNFNQIDNFTLDYAAMQQVVKHRQINLTDHKNHKLGIYCTTDIGYAFSRMYQIMMDDFAIETLISRSLEEVESFLRVSLADIRRQTG